MRPPRLLTIAGETQSVAAWSRVPGAQAYATIIRRLNQHVPDALAVFADLQDPGIRAQRVYRAKHQPRPKGFRYPVTLTQWGSVSSVTWRVSA